MLQITKYQPRYHTQIIQMILKIQTEEFSFPVTIDDQPDLKDIPAYYLKGNGNFWVATEDDKVVGTIGLIDINNSRCGLRKMFVAKEYRGKEKNIAKSLLDGLLKWGRDKELKEIYLGTVDAFVAAQKFYQKSGFVEIDKNLLPKEFSALAIDNRFYVYRF